MRNWYGHMEKLTNEQLIDCFTYVRKQLLFESLGMCSLISRWIYTYIDSYLLANDILDEGQFQILLKHKPVNVGTWWFPIQENAERIKIVEKILSELRDKV